MNARQPSDSLGAPALYEQVAERLRTRIYAHELPPGAWIDEQSIADEFGISRTPMREALKVLASEGLVILKPRRGCYVAEMSERDIDEIFLYSPYSKVVSPRRPRAVSPAPTFHASKSSTPTLSGMAPPTTPTSSSKPTRPSTTPCSSSPATAGCRS